MNTGCPIVMVVWLVPPLLKIDPTIAVFPKVSAFVMIRLPCWIVVPEGCTLLLVGLATETTGAAGLTGAEVDGAAVVGAAVVGMAFAVTAGTAGKSVTIGRGREVDKEIGLGVIGLGVCWTKFEF